MAKTNKEIYSKRYRAHFIEPGIISYEDMEAGTVLVQRSALDRMRDTFIGKPVVNEDHIDLEPNEAFRVDGQSNPQADGVVVDVGTDANGWDYADLIIWNQETIKNIDENGYSVSCAYMPTKVISQGGMWHNINYDEEVIEGEYTHMAVVDNPRYEGATIYANSKRSDKPMAKFKIFGKKTEQKTNMAPPPEEKKEELEMESAVVEVDGEMVPLEEAMNAYREMKKNEVTPMDPEDTIEVDGEQVKVSELVAALQAAKQNVGDPKDIKMEPVVEEALQNKKGGNPPGKKNETQEQKNKHFKTLQNAASKEMAADHGIKTKAERLARGQAKYGTVQPVKEVTA